ncbi:MAG TPA: 50S ribosomal protein L3 [Ignavibacteriales bacterium]|nr:50S ribosomal protein L3 [Ignavibacteriales bacterium]
MPALIGKKLGMTNIFDNDGKIIPVTIVQAGPCTVVNVRTLEKNGYEAVQLGYEKVKESKLNKPLLGYFNKLGVEPVRILKEFRNIKSSDYKIGDVINVETFAEGEKVNVKGVSKGKGFQGVMKRHGFGGVGGTTHGQSDRLRAPGSIGASSYPSRVFKGQRMAGRTGCDNITVRNLQIVKIDKENNLLFIKGAIPGHNNSIVEIIK